MSEDSKTPEQDVHSRPAGWPPFLRAATSKPQPWSNRLVWNLALWSLIVAVVVTVIWAAALFEKRLDERSKERLAAAGVDASTLNLRWSYRDLHVHGELPVGTDSEQLIQILRQQDGSDRSFLARGIRDIKVSAKPAAIIEPIVSLPEELPELDISLVMQRDTATLDGIVESSEQRRALVEALLATGVESIHDNLEVADLENNAAITDTKVDVLAAMVRSTTVDNISRFSASLNRQRLDYQVSALNRETAVGVENAASVAIMNFDVSGKSSVANGAMVSVDVQSSDTELTLDGQVFSDEQHRRLSFAAMEATAGNKRIVDNITVSSLSANEPGSDVRVEGLAGVIARLKSDVSGHVKMRGSDLSINATVASEEAKTSLKEVASLARTQGVAVIENIVVSNERQIEDPVAALQNKLNGLAAEVQENVVFNSGNARLTSDAKFTLDLVVEVLAAYSGLKVEIEGHTDNVGRSAVNEELSRDRAAAVRQYLIEQSIDATRLVAVGYGSRDPLASNDTSEGRKRNRRVHFHVPNPQLIEQ